MSQANEPADPRSRRQAFPRARATHRATAARHAPASRILAFAAALAAGLAAGCERSATAPPSPGALVVVAGGSQVGVAGQPLAQPLVVRVDDSGGNPLRSITVQWQVTAGNGGVSAASTPTGADGTATVTWTLGTVAGPNSLAASVSGLTAVTFTSEGEAGPPASVVVHAGDGQTAPAGSAVAIPPAVRVGDAHGNAVAGVTATCTTTGGGGSVTSGTAVTDAGGVAAVGAWVLGTTVGENELSCVAGALPAAVFVATAEAGAPAGVVILEGAGQSATVGTPVPVAPAVLVHDAHDNPVYGQAVTFAVASGGGSVLGGSAVTDEDGVARSGAWTLGTAAGPNTLTASVAGLSPATFEATGTPDAPASVQIAAGDGQEATVATTVPIAPSVVVRDAHDNPVPGTEVAFDVTGGGGNVSGEVRITDEAGAASVGGWTLGPTPGANALRASVPGGASVTFSATGLLGAAAIVGVAGGDGQSATVGTAVPVPPSVRVEDAAGNPVPGVAVSFAVTAGGGTIASPGGSTDQLVTDDEGVATLIGWVLGLVAGVNSLSAGVEGLSPAMFTATGTPDDPAQVAVAGGDGQTAAVESPVPVQPSALVTDVHGNPVEDVPVTFAVAQGGGNVTGASTTTDAGGIATVGSWTLGSAAGANALTATVAGLAPATFNATAEEPDASLNLFVEAVHLNQSNQDVHGTIGGVAGRRGLLRVVVQANESNSVAPDVRVRLYQGASLLREEILPAPQSGIPVAPDLRNPNHTYDLDLPAVDVVPDLRVAVLVDPDELIAESSKADNAFPQGGGTASLDVQTIPDFNIVFIPIEATVHSTTGSVTAGNTGTFLRATRQWFPVSTIVPTVRAAFTTNEDLSTSDGWMDLIVDIQAVRTAESATDEYYHGIIGDFPGIAYGGLGYVPSSNSSSFRTALSYDRSVATTGTETVGHELGHNHGRRHAPCGGAGNPDASYPYSNAEIGPPGFDVESGSLITSSNYRDYLSYCAPRWTSDYTYGHILTWRRTDPLASQSAGVARTGGLLVWGRIDSRGVKLNPAFAIESVPSLPHRPGPNMLRGVSADGREVFRLSFEGVEVSESNDPEERHFSFFVPLAAAGIEAMASIELTTPRASARRVSPAALDPSVGAAFGGDPEVRLEPAGAGRVRLRWDDARHPVAMVRDAATGRILAFARGGDASVVAGSLGPERIEVLVSDGARSRVARPE